MLVVVRSSWPMGRGQRNWAWFSQKGEDERGNNHRLFFLKSRWGPRLRERIKPHSSLGCPAKGQAVMVSCSKANGNWSKRKSLLCPKTGSGNLGDFDNSRCQATCSYIRRSYSLSRRPVSSKDTFQSQLFYDPQFTNKAEGIH